MFSLLKKYKLAIPFSLILAVAIFFRFYNLQNVPPSASLDEATIGWNAYSLLQTGHDEYGYHFPILLRAYDDYRPALYVYLVIPFVKLFGLTVFAVRLPSVIMSVLTVVMTFFLVRSLLFVYKKRDSLALCTMGLLAISPWHIYLSRLGHEVNLGLTLVVLGSLVFFLFIEHKKAWLFSSSCIIFALSFYSYQSEKVFVPLFIFLLLCVFYKQVLKVKKHLIIGVILATAISLPMVIVSFSSTGMLRFQGTSVFSNNPAYSISAKQLLIAKEKHDLLGEILNNRRITTIKIFASNYFSHFSPWWIFGNSGDESFKAPHTGLLYVWELPFFYLGIVFLLFNKEVTKSVKGVVIGWVFIDFLAPGVTTQAPHAMRAFTLLPIPSLLSSLGIIAIISTLARYVSKTVAIAILFFLVFIAMQSVSAFFMNYFETFPVNDSRSFQYALAKAIPFILKESNNYQHTVISNKNMLYQSYMFYLFYTKFDPKQYAKEGGTKSGGFNESHVIRNVIFRPIVWEKESKQNTLFVGNPQDFPPSVSTLSTFYYLDGTPGVTIVGQK